MMARLSVVSRISVFGMLRAQAAARRAASAAMERNRIRRSKHGAGSQSIGGRGHGMAYTRGMSIPSQEALARFFETSPAARKATKPLSRDARVALDLSGGP